MDRTEQMAADIALAIDGGDWQDAKWFSKFHREAWIKAVQPYADEIERLREQAHYHYENGLKKDVEIARLRETVLEIVYQIGQGNNVAAMDIAAPIAAAYIQQKGE